MAFEEKLTVDSNGEALREDEAVSAHECRNTTKFVDFKVDGRDARGWDGLNELEVDVVLLCNGQNTNRARIALRSID